MCKSTASVSFELRWSQFVLGGIRRNSPKFVDITYELLIETDINEMRLLLSIYISL